MNKLKIILSMLVIVLLVPFVIAQENDYSSTDLELEDFNEELDEELTEELTEEIEDVLEEELEPETEEQKEIEDVLKEELEPETEELEEQEEQNRMCSDNAQRACEIINELGIKEGQGVPFVLPKNGALNMKFFDETLIGYFEIKEGLISKIVCCEEHQEPTHTVKITNIDAVEEIRQAEDFLDEANKKLTAGQITIDTTGFMNNARITLGKAFIRIASWFR